LWTVVLVGLTLVLAVGLFALRRWVKREDGRAESAWTLHELTQLRDSGELTIEQYERLRANLVAEIRRTIGKVGKDGPMADGESKGDL